MWTLSNKDRKYLENAKKKLAKCSGDCKHCEHCKLQTSLSGSFYCYVCGHTDKFMQYISDTMRELKAETLKQIDFELN